MTKQPLGVTIGAVAVVALSACSKKDGPSLSEIEAATAPFIKVHGAIHASLGNVSGSGASLGDVHVASAECKNRSVPGSDEANAVYSCAIHYKWDNGTGEDHTIQFRQNGGRWVVADMPAELQR